MNDEHGSDKFSEDLFNMAEVTAPDNVNDSEILSPPADVEYIEEALDEISTAEDNIETESHSVKTDSASTSVPEPAYAPEPAYVPEPVHAPEAVQTFEQMNHNAPPSSAKKRVIMPRSEHIFSLPARFTEKAASLGEIMRYARETSGFSMEEVADYTKIRIEYMRDIEEDKMKKLPPHAFVSAYIRTLGNIYGLDADGVKFAQNKLAGESGAVQLQPSIMQSLEEEVTVNEDEFKRVKRMITIAGIVVGILIILGIWAIIAAVAGSRSDDYTYSDETTPYEEISDIPTVTDAPVQDVFDASQLETLVAPQQPEASVLEFKQTPAIRR